MTSQRAMEIMEQAKLKTKGGPWVDQLDVVMTEEEVKFVKAKWETMPGHTGFVHALLRIANNK